MATIVLSNKGQQVKSNLYIGLSGGIASGKTIVSDEFSSLGADIIDTDIIARN